GSDAHRYFPPVVGVVVPEDEPDEGGDSTAPFLVGSMTIWRSVASKVVPSARFRVTCSVTVYSIVTVESASQSADHDHKGSSSNGVSPWDVIGSAPETNSLILLQQSCWARLVNSVSSARSEEIERSCPRPISDIRKIAMASSTSRIDMPCRRAVGGSTL